MRDGLDNLWSSDEHHARALDHERKVGQSGRVDRATRARPHDHRDLRDDARCSGVAHKDVAIAAQRQDALLDASTARVVDADQGSTHLERQILHLDDLGGVGLAQRPAHDGKVLGKHIHQTPIDGAIAGDHAIARLGLVGHLLRRALDQRVELLKTTLI